MTLKPRPNSFKHLLCTTLFVALLGATLSGCGSSQAADTPEQQQQKAADAAAAAKTDALNREARRKQQNQPTK